TRSPSARTRPRAGRPRARDRRDRGARARVRREPGVPPRPLAHAGKPDAGGRPGARRPRPLAAPLRGGGAPLCGSGRAGGVGSPHAHLHLALEPVAAGRADAEVESRSLARGEPRRRGARRQGAAPVGDPRRLRLRQRRRGAGHRNDRTRVRRARSARIDAHPDAARADDRRVRRDAELVRLHRDAPDGHAPRLARGEELVRVDVGEPAEEVRRRIVLGAAEHRGIDLRRRLLALPARDLVGAALPLLRSGTFHVSTRHSGTVPEALSVRNLQKRYGSVQALKGVDLEVGEGELFGLLGPNGAGKSTLVKIAVGLVRPTRGEATVAGARAGSRAARAQLGYLAEMFRFPGWYTADEVLELHQRLAGSRGGAAERTRLLEL